MFGRLATNIIVVAWFLTGAVSAYASNAAQPAAAGAPDAGGRISGIFVSLGTDPKGTIVTIDQSGSLTSMRVNGAVAVTEDEVGAAPHAASLAALKPGEPIEAQLQADGSVAAIVARYASVATQVTASKTGYTAAADGNAYKLVGAAAAAAASLDTGTYVLLRTDPASGNAFDLAASRQPFRATGQQAVAVAVTFVVRVPANTPPSDAVYLASNGGNWTPNGLRLAPLSGGRWTVTVQLAAGTQIEYRYTRGSWATDERTAAGTPTANRTIAVAKSGGAQSV